MKALSVEPLTLTLTLLYGEPFGKLFINGLVWSSCVYSPPCGGQSDAFPSRIWPGLTYSDAFHKTRELVLRTDSLSTFAVTPSSPATTRIPPRRHSHPRPLPTSTSRCTPLRAFIGARRSQDPPLQCHPVDHPLAVSIRHHLLAASTRSYITARTCFHALVLARTRTRPQTILPRGSDTHRVLQGSDHYHSRSLVARCPSVRQWFEPVVIGISLVRTHTLHHLFTRTLILSRSLARQTRLSRTRTRPRTFTPRGRDTLRLARGRDHSRYLSLLGLLSLRLSHTLVIGISLVRTHTLPHLFTRTLLLARSLARQTRLPRTSTRPRTVTPRGHDTLRLA